MNFSKKAKYSNLNLKIPKESRKEINEKILFLITSKRLDEYGITKEEIFNSYTGKGGLHGLSRSNFDNYYDYSEEKKKFEIGQFFTPSDLAKFVVGVVNPSINDQIVDFSCGIGSFFNHCPNEHNLYGCEIDYSVYSVAKFLFPEANIHRGDMLEYSSNISFDIVFGNPPFGLKLGKYGELSEMVYISLAGKLLKPSGILAIIVPDSFCKDEFMDGGQIKTIERDFDFLLEVKIPNEFDISIDTKILFFQKRLEDSQDKISYKITENNSIVINEFSEDLASSLHEKYIKAPKEELERYRCSQSKISSFSKEQEEFNYKIEKLLFDIKRSKYTKSRYPGAISYFEKYKNQSRPDNMDYEEWEKVKITPNKLISFLKRILAEQHIKERDSIELVKTNYGIKLKAYSHKKKLELSKIKEKEWLINELVLNDYYPMVSSEYRQLIERKRKEYLKSCKFIHECSDSKIRNFLENFSLTNMETGEVIKLNPTQIQDLERILVKRNAILNWEMGSGKSIGSIAWIKYISSQEKHPKPKFIIAPALAINLNWEKVLRNFGIPFWTIRSIDDLNHLNPKYITLISFNMLIKYEKLIKKYIKINSNNISVVVDESDEMTNHTSKRTKSTLNCFRRAKNKLLTTGTTTRNNINELYSQLELIYNNSIGMLCECKYFYDRGKDDIEESLNPYFNKPFPAYYGNGVFRKCFSPEKVTVFGIKKQNQDVYNKDALINIIQRTILTRTFHEITGKKPIFKTHYVNQNVAEETLYATIITEFFKLNYFKKTGNAKKDRMLEIIRQLQLLIKATSIPNQFKEYGSTETPGKQKYIVSHIGETKEKVAIGCLFLESVDVYSRLLSDAYPHRPIFIIKGEVNFKKRNNIIEQFEETEDGILISTQQSLKSSVNIASCNKIIIESLPWNLPKLAQYYFRFIRYNSKDEKEVNFIVYKNTIEQNLLALLMDKQRINDYIKTLDFRDRNDIFMEYDIDFNLLDMVMEKVKTDNGIKINWGRAKVN